MGGWLKHRKALDPTVTVQRIETLKNASFHTDIEPQIPVSVAFGTVVVKPTCIIFF